MVFDRALNPECHALEPPECTHNRECADPETNGFSPCGEPARGEDKVVQQVAQHENGKVQSRELCRKRDLVSVMSREMEGVCIRT